MATINNIQMIKFPVVEDSRGNLAFIQNDILPFEFKRIYCKSSFFDFGCYYLYNIFLYCCLFNRLFHIIQA